MIGSDIRHALRSLARQRLATGMVVGMLALGIAANVAVFGLVNGLFLRPFPFPAPDRLVNFNEKAPKWNLEVVGINYPDFDQWRKDVKLFESMAAYDIVSVNASSGGNAERLRGATVTHDFARVLGIQPIAGRMFTADEDRPKAAPVVLLGYGLWQERFGGARDVIGKSIRLDGVARTIIGVLPREAEFPGDVRFWVPLGGDPNQPYQSYGLDGIGRLKPGVSARDAEKDMLRAHEAVWKARDHEKIVSPFVQPLRDEFVRDFGAIASTLSGAVGLLLVVACANVAAVMLARALARRREMGIRLALGASRTRLVRQLFVENLLLAAAGGTLGLLLGQWGLRALLATVPDELPKWAVFDADWRTIAFTVGAAAATVILFGWAPALHAVRGDLRSAVHESSAAATTSPRGRRTLWFLVAAEFGMAAVLLVCGGLLLRAFDRVRHVDPGFDPRNVLTFSVALPEAAYGKEDARQAFWDRLTTRLGSLPGVESAGLVTCAPLGCHWGTFFRIEGGDRRPGDDVPVTLYRYASAGYFGAMGIRLKEGRFLDDRDGRPNQPRVAIVNETFAKAFWPGQHSPLGRRFKFNDDKEPWITVVGLARDIKHYGLERPMRPGIYLPLPSSPAQTMTVALRTKTTPEGMVTPARAAIHELDPDLPLFQVKTMEEAVARSTSTRAAFSWLLGVFSLLALVLALGGSYGVASYLVTQRTREIGIRLALGARTADVVRTSVGRGVQLVVLGVAAGILVSFAVTRKLGDMLFGVDPRDGAVLGSVVLLLLATSVLANWLPARRAARTDPMQSLRTD